jgi:iron complex outermembrane receptor protein
MRKFLLGSACLIITGGMPVGTALAASSLLDEVVVTAQRREELAQDIPLAVTAYTESQLEKLQVTDTLDIGQLVPNLMGHHNTGIGTANSYFLRGLGNSESIATFDPPIGTYVDDIYVARQNANNLTLFDVDRIEVLRGPQGTLFGRNTTGGALRVILKKPAEEIGGYIEAGYGEFERKMLRGSIDLPVNDRILTKLSGYYIEDDGFVTSTTTGEDDINSERNYGVRGHVLLNITEQLAWHIAVDYIDTDRANLANYRVNGDRYTDTGLSQHGRPLQGLMTGSKQNYGLGNEATSFDISSVIDWDIGDAGTLSFITGWRDLDNDYALDFLNGTPSYGGYTIANKGNHEQFTQEVKWVADLGDKVKYVAGFYYFDEENTTDFAEVFNLGFPFLTADRIMNNNTEAYAFYLQGDYALTDRWTLTAGVRYTDEDKDIRYTDNNPCPPGDPCFIDANGDGVSDDDLDTANMVFLGVPTSQDKQIWTPRFVASYTATEDVNLYVSATEGFKSGGWNARGTLPELLLPFESEEVWSYEAGMKSEWLDNRLRTNLAAFYSDVTDFQLPAGFNGPTGIVFITQNFADLEVYGLEADITYSPVDALTLFANIGLQKAEYKNLDPSIIAQQQSCINTTVGCGVGIVNEQGGIADPMRTPDYTLNLGFNYTWAMTPSFELVYGAWLYSVDDHNVGSAGIPIDLVDGYSTWTGSITLNQLDQGWSLTAECKNCNDAKMNVSELAGIAYIADPRTWMLRLKYKFGSSQ